jgi:hypothetical protein
VKEEGAVLGARVVQQLPGQCEDGRVQCADGDESGGAGRRGC